MKVWIVTVEHDGPDMGHYGGHPKTDILGVFSGEEKAQRFLKKYKARYRTAAADTEFEIRQTTVDRCRYREVYGGY